MPRSRSSKVRPARASAIKGGEAHPVSGAPVAFRAGCGREWNAVSPEADLAYTAQEFGDCPGCPHRVEPEGTLPFCTLRPAKTAHPFAALAELEWPE